mmetsp:Transcript_20395/g.53338  ORF Transcript_20395/g.53338 Transcript_20395/m.53338 type:complete len:254 (-) Transcript_20395:925-1686(-)
MTPSAFWHLSVVPMPVPPLLRAAKILACAFEPADLIFRPQHGHSLWELLAPLIYPQMDAHFRSWLSRAHASAAASLDLTEMALEGSLVTGNLCLHTRTLGGHGNAARLCYAAGLTDWDSTGWAHMMVQGLHHGAPTCQVRTMLPRFLSDGIHTGAAGSVGGAGGQMRAAVGLASSNQRTGPPAVCCLRCVPHCYHRSAEMPSPPTKARLPWVAIHNQCSRTAECWPLHAPQYAELDPSYHPRWQMAAVPAQGI